jgi:hypothetical protein
MKPSRRRHIEKANTPKDIADQFRELQKLRIKVSEAELAAVQEKAVDVETQVEGDGHSQPIGRSQTH